MQADGDLFEEVAESTLLADFLQTDCLSQDFSQLFLGNHLLTHANVHCPHMYPVVNKVLTWLFHIIRQQEKRIPVVLMLIVSSLVKEEATESQR